MYRKFAIGILIASPIIAGAAARFASISHPQDSGEGQLDTAGQSAVHGAEPTPPAKPAQTQPPTPEHPAPAQYEASIRPGASAPTFDPSPTVTPSPDTPTAVAAEGPREKTAQPVAAMRY